jgi:simple sugar transport system substrate-binding protein
MRITPAIPLLLAALALGGANAAPAEAQPREVIVLALERGRASQERQTRLLRLGATEAARDLGVELDVRPLRGTQESRSDLLATIVEEGPDGLVIAAEDPEALRGPIEEAAAAGIGVVLAWAGIDAWQDVGALAFVGADERLGGDLAGARLAELGSRRALCVIDNVNDRRLDERCTEAGAAFATAGGRMSVLRALDPPGDPTGVRDAIEARLLAEPDIDAVLATEDDGIRWALQAVERTERADRVRLAAFDPDPDTLQALADGRVAFAVATQPYLQGYLPVVILSGWQRRGLVPGGGQPILTGPRLLSAADAMRLVGPGEP